MERVREDPKLLTEAGATIWSLMLEKGVRTLVELGKMMRDPNGKPVTNARLSSWLRGINSPPDWLGREIARVLDLDEERRIRLGVALAFGADVKKNPAA